MYASISSSCIEGMFPCVQSYTVQGNLRDTYTHAVILKYCVLSPFCLEEGVFPCIQSDTMRGNLCNTQSHTHTHIHMNTHTHTRTCPHIHTQGLCMYIKASWLEGQERD
jgi:hypothetical protein